MQDYVIKPHAGPQERFIALPDDIKECLFGGAVGPGKSWCLLALPIIREFYKHPAFRGIIFRKTYPQLEKYLIPESKLMYPKFGGVYNETKHVWRFPSGATMEFSFIETHEDAYEYDGIQYNYIGWDELTHFDDWVYTYLFRSSRSGSKDLPAIIRATSNPGNVGHNWVRARFIEPAREGYKKLYNPDSKSYRIFIPAFMKDNPTLLENNPNYANDLENLPEAERRAKIHGDWWAFSGQVFAEFREFHRLDEPEFAKHVIEPFTIPSYWPKILSIDWGYTHKTSVHWHAISPDGRLYTFDEYTASKKSVIEWGAEVGRIDRQYENRVLAVMDPSAWKTESHGLTIAEQFTSASDILVEKAINDRINGKLHYHEMLRWRKKPAKYAPKEGYSIETADRIYRMYGEKAREEYKDLFTPEKEETNLPKWQIFNTCKELIKVIPILVYDERRTEDVAKIDGDDSYDDTRYGIMGYKTYLTECEKDHARFQEIAKCVNRLETTGDQTAFHRQMERIEAGSKQALVPFDRFEARKRFKRSLYRAS